MNNEQQQIIDEAYENYSREYEKDNSIGTFLPMLRVDGKHTYRKLDKERFIGLCIYDEIFSERWGLKIEERELSLEERTKLAKGKVVFLLASKEDSYNHARIPTKLITVTYNNETIESYE